jgi:hypothetical protein
MQVASKPELHALLHRKLKVDSTGYSSLASDSQTQAGRSLHLGCVQTAKGAPLAIMSPFASWLMALHQGNA